MSDQDFIDDVRRRLATQQDLVADRAGRLTEIAWDVSPSEMAIERLVSHGHFTTHTGELEFTPRGVVCHLLHAAEVYIDRIARLRTGGEPEFGEFDTTGSERLDELRQSEETLLLQNLERYQQELRMAVASVEPGELDQVGVDPRDGQVSLRDVLGWLPDHEEDHADQLAALTAESIG